MNTSTLPYSSTTLELGPMENFIYLIHDHASGRVAVVDPAWEPDVILARVREKNLRITDILLTHSHNDHINALDALLAKHDAQVHLLKDEAKFWGKNQDLPSLHYGGDSIALGETKIEVSPCKAWRCCASWACKTTIQESTRMAVRSAIHASGSLWNSSSK